MIINGLYNKANNKNMLIYLGTKRIILMLDEQYCLYKGSICKCVINHNKVTLYFCDEFISSSSYYSFKKCRIQ